MMDTIDTQPSKIEALGHLLTLTDEGCYHCERCWNSYKGIPEYTKCPECPVFHGLWEKAFKEARGKIAFDEERGMLLLLDWDD